MVGSLLPVPLKKLRPVTVASVSVPLPALRVRRTELLPASVSATVIELPLVVLNTKFVSSATPCAAGTVSTGASLTALTPISTELPIAWAPPAPLLPWSLIVTFRLSAPLKFGLAL